jgi:RNA-directed DNA polymerase
MTNSSGMTYAHLVTWENLLLAYRKASWGKRGKPNTAAFEYTLSDHLIRLQRELQTFTYQPGAYTHFIIHDPKHRKISAAPFRDRVVHHALCNLIEPPLDATFIPDSYANRIGKGTHRALDRLQGFAQQYRYVLRLDIVKHFPSLDHAILQAMLNQVVPDAGLQWLITRIIASGAGVLDDEYTMVYFAGDDLFAAQRPRGLPIGNLTSQFWSNIYLNPFDWFVVRELGCPTYLRYVDDFALFSDSKRQLYVWKQQIIQYLARLRLTIHEPQAQVMPVSVGIP